jgi:hypothetical protein
LFSGKYNYNHVSIKYIRKYIQLKANLLYKKNTEKLCDENIGLDDFFQEVLSYNVSKNSILMHFFELMLYIRFFENIFKKIQPKIFICTNYPTIMCMAAIYVCNMRNIITIDLQHGVQGQYHLSYSSWKKVPNIGYMLLPRKYFVWSDIECETINSWGEKVGHVACKTGNLFLQKWLNDNDGMVKKYDPLIDAVLDKRQTTIIYCMSDEVPPEVFINFMQKHTEYNYVIRLHPKRKYLINELKKAVSFNMCNLYVEQMESYPLYAILRKVSVVVTSYSSVVLESIEFGHKPIVVHEWGAELYSSELAKGKCIYAKDLNDLEEAVQTVVDFIKTRVNESFDGTKRIGEYFLEQINN